MSCDGGRRLNRLIFLSEILVICSEILCGSKRLSIHRQSIIVIIYAGAEEVKSLLVI